MSMKKKMYDNCLLLAHDGTKMAYVDRDKANWYVKNNLGTIEEDTENIFSVKLNLSNPRYLERLDQIKKGEMELDRRENKCVVCGTEDEEVLSKHHVLPYCFRRHLPIKHKEHKSEDIVVLCFDCHRRYETIANKKKRDMIQKYEKPYEKDIIALKKSMRNIFIFLNRRNKNAEYDEACEYVEANFPGLSNDELSELGNKFYAEIYSLSNHNGSGFRKIMEEVIAGGEKEIDRFTMDWYDHFTAEMKPKFWTPKRDRVEIENPIKGGSI